MNHVIPIAFLVTVLLITLPTTSNVSAQQIETKSQIDGICGVTITEDIDLGPLTPGSDGLETDTFFETSGSLTSTISVEASDWVGDGSYATGKIYLVNVEDGDSITINGLVYNANTPAENVGDFGLGKTDSVGATRLAITINNDTREGITVPTQDVTAISIGNMVKIQATVLGKTGNDIDVTSKSTEFTITNPTLSNAQDIGEVHLDASVTRYAITTDGIESEDTPYTNKSSLGTTGESIILTSHASPAADVKLSLQISGINTLQHMPYIGDITQTLTFTITCND